MVRTVLIDDSQNAIDALAKKLEAFKNEISVVSTFTNPVFAIKELPLINPDLIFLDIEMPEMDGFAFLDSLKGTSPSIIFVTAYNYYAIKAIRASAFDYLEKPIDVQQLEITLTRYIKNQKSKTSNVLDSPLLKDLMLSVQKLEKTQKHQTIAVISKDSIDLLQFTEIIRLESMSNYTKFHLLDGRVLLSSKTMGEYEETLLANNFLRIHRSHIINLLYMKKFQRNNENYVLMKDGSKIEVSDRRKKELLDILGKL
ncbi:MAG: hypothetical protein RLZZ546_1451 [Bacteroidota bacterium]|jgi:two-component system LytT family response regulator